MRMYLFFLILLAAVWQDVRSRSLSVGFLIGAAAAGIVGTAVSGGNLFLQLQSALPGAVLLFLCRLTDGAIGEGDGWFFVISGMFLKLQENILLLLSGTAFCGLWSLWLISLAFLSGKSIRNARLPFLPFLLPAGIGLVFF